MLISTCGLFPITCNLSFILLILRVIAMCCAIFSGTAVMLSVKTLSLPSSEFCNGDYLEVRDLSYESRPFGTFCGSSAPEKFTSQNGLWVKFSSKTPVAPAGDINWNFFAEYSIGKEKRKTILALPTLRVEFLKNKTSHQKICPSVRWGTTYERLVV